ncbi:MAG: hypothetical protein IPJ30_01650 [Acidobacteria bacterium]|nr:hypothetical protein [Acidobacteriota bacterium]
MIEPIEIGRFRGGTITRDAILVDVKLTNRCRTDIYYLSKFTYFEPYGFLLYRRENAGWEADTPAWGRGFGGLEYRWRPLRNDDSVCAQFTGSLNRSPEVSVALYYSYSRTPAQDSIIEIQSSPIRLNLKSMLTKTKLRPIEKMLPNCERKSDIGYLLGAINRFGSIENRAELTIVLSSNGVENRAVSDSYGEFNLELPVGTYYLIKVLDKNGKALRTKRIQIG